MTDATLTPEEREAIRKLAEAATKVAPGEWECDGVDNEDGHGKFQSYAIYLSGGRSICDTLNSSIIEIEQEVDEDGVSAFDRVGLACMEFVAAANPVAVLTLISALDAANRRADEADIEIGRLTAIKEALESSSASFGKRMHEAVSDLTALRARVAALEAGGCARDQGTTQYCAEAVALQKRVAVMQEALEIIAGKRQCIDNLMSNQDVALAALKKEPTNAD